MTNILQIYENYKIPPNLIRHQLEVTAVGQYICDHWIEGSVNKLLVTQTLLLHDMGNILKFKRPFGGELEVNAAYWLEIQSQYRQKYGSNVHEATVMIAKELNVSSALLEMIQMFDPEYLSVHGYKNDELYVANYADMCVSPTGIVGFEARMIDLKIRYGEADALKHKERRTACAQYVAKHTDVNLSSLARVDFLSQIEGLKEFELG